MKRLRLILTILSIAILLLSCDDSLKNTGRTILISVASDYTDNNISDLVNTPNDQAALAGQIYALSKGNVEMFLYRIEKGERFYVEDVSDINDIFDFEKELENVEVGNTIARRIPAKLDNWEKVPTFSFNTIKNKIKSLNAGKDDLIIFHYSGHGDKDGSLVLTLDDSSQAMRVNDLLALFSQYNEGAKKLAILDSCFSGNFIKDGILASEKNFKLSSSIEEYTGSSIFTAITGSYSIARGKDSYGTPDVYVLAAATKNQESFDAPGSGINPFFGAFSYYLLRALGFDMMALEPTSWQKEITVYSLYNEIWKSFPSYSKKEQTPSVTLSPMDLVLF